ncbi:glucose-6-phosphate dehydrogenase [Microbacterium deminutum]|uniref:Glucose-6-phosphate dehydrogenase n=1 Tax=Microbacterium deminutum TaxID=344164 RepID=A0ABN2Q952_9MICO
MRVAKTADWRDAIPFETPMLVADVVPGEMSRCSVCGGGSELRSRSELWAVKHRHPHHHDGYVRFYCSEHVPRVQVTVSSPALNPVRGERRPAAHRSPAASDVVRAMCPDCFIEVSATGQCGNCGLQVV